MVDIVPDSSDDINLLMEKKAYVTMLKGPVSFEQKGSDENL